MLLVTLGTVLIPALAAFITTVYCIRTDTIHRQIKELHRTVKRLEM